MKRLVRRTKRQQIHRHMRVVANAPTRCYGNPDAAIVCTSNQRRRK
jgi:hypothetical protein